MTLTKEILEQTFKINNVDSSGNIYKDGKLLPTQNYSDNYKFGNKYNYQMVALYHKGKRFRFMKSRIVWAWFNDICPYNMDVDHINYDTFDNRIENLRLLSRKENRTKHKCPYPETSLKFWQRKREQEQNEKTNR